MLELKEQPHHSEKMQKIFDTPPAFIIRWGISIIAIALVLIGVAVAYFCGIYI